jgi:uncharacterized phage-like protein YoqJ
MIVGVTGHRPKTLGWGYDLTNEKYKYLYWILKKYLESFKATHCISGMALGVDTVFAFAALRYSQENPEKHIIVECAIPCIDQEKMWSKKDQEIYHYLLKNSDKVTYVSNETYSPELMMKRNEYIVDTCDKLLAVWNGEKGGTKNCIAYAVRKNKEIFRLNPVNI